METVIALAIQQGRGLIAVSISAVDADDWFRS